MYGGILSIDYSRNDSGLLLSFPGRHQLFVMIRTQWKEKSHILLVQKIPIFLFIFILRFEYPLTIDELAVSNKNSDSIPLHFEQTKTNHPIRDIFLSARNKQLITRN